MMKLWLVSFDYLQNTAIIHLYCEELSVWQSEQTTPHKVGLTNGEHYQLPSLGQHYYPYSFGTRYGRASCINITMTVRHSWAILARSNSAACHTSVENNTTLLLTYSESNQTLSYTLCIYKILNGIKRMKQSSYIQSPKPLHGWHWYIINIIYIYMYIITLCTTCKQM